jgi:hypothetical protein
MHFSESYDDYYFILARGNKFDMKYNLLVIPSTLCNVNKLTWFESETKTAWKGFGEFSAVIGKSFSAKLWTSIPLDLITHNIPIHV